MVIAKHWLGNHHRHQSTPTAYSNTDKNQHCQRQKSWHYYISRTHYTIAKITMKTMTRQIKPFLLSLPLYIQHSYWARQPWAISDTDEAQEIVLTALTKPMIDEQLDDDGNVIITQLIFESVNMFHTKEHKDLQPQLVLVETQDEYTLTSKDDGTCDEVYSFTCDCADLLSIALPNDE